MEADRSPFVYASANLLSPTVLADAISLRPRERAFTAEMFAPPGGDPPSSRRLAEDIEAAYDLAQERYDAVRERFDELSTSEVRERWLMPLLYLLEFGATYQRQYLQPNPADRRTFSITHLGWDDHQAPPLVLVAGDLDARPGPRRRSPHEELQLYLNLSEKRWGIAANTYELRLVRDFYHARLKAFVGFDLRGIFESRDFSGFSALYRLCHASRFVPRGEEHLPVLEKLFEDSQREGVQVGKRLRPGIVEAIETVANGVLTPELREYLRAGGEPARGFFRELLMLVYRILFCMFAEQRGLLPTSGLYAEAYSVTHLREVAERRLADPAHVDLFEGLKATFRLLHRGAPEIEVYPYDGPLFDLSATSTLNAARLRNGTLMQAIRALTSVEIERLRQRVDFALLGVDELGSVYESLLPYALRVAEAPTEVEGRLVEAGSVYLDPVSTERADLGAHYTRPELVDFVLEISLDRLIRERLDAAGEKSAARERAILGLTVIDPACGSGAFLVAAVDRLAAALAAVRSGDEQPTETEMQRCRREVLQHCIYGVDKDLFAVELCKVALWIHCAVKDRPLTFLDHRIQHGDALVGWGPRSLPREIPTEAFQEPRNAARLLKTFLRGARERNDSILNGQGELDSEPVAPILNVPLPDLESEEGGPSDVHRKVERYEAYLDSPEYVRWKASADIWSAAFFWGPESGNPPTSSDYWRALDGRAAPNLAREAMKICESFPTLHWPLRFPEVFARGGFDCVLGNPPWEQFESREEEWWAAAGYGEIAAARGASRKALIDDLEIKDPEALSRWHRFEQANVRLAEYSRVSGRFTHSGGKANTYLLFTELTADLLAPTGRAGILVKSALALDKGSQSVFQRLLEQRRVEDFHDIVNGGREGSGRIFAHVADVERFAVLGLRGAPGSGAFASTVMNWNIEEARTRQRRSITVGDLAILNPRTRSLTSFRHLDELEVALAIHQASQTLDFDDGGANRWGLSYHTLFNSTTASHLFLKREELEAEGWVLGQDKVFRRDEDVALPIYEGQMANRYDHRARTYEGYEGQNKYGRKPNIPWSTDEQKSDPAFEVEPRYWMLEGHTVARLAATVSEKILIGFRDVSRTWTDQRSAKGAILPRRPATHTLPILAVPSDRAVEFLAVFNSTVFDFLVRGHMPGSHVALTWMLSQIAAPAPGLDHRITEAAAHRSLTSYSVASLLSIEPYHWDHEGHYDLDVMIDAMVAHAYKLTKEQYEIVLDSFEVMAREQIRSHGYYKFKDDCLQAYEEANQRPILSIGEERVHDDTPAGAASRVERG